mmetsp:Transcript_51553/g.112554  ORF Transcript_51553/g.112554 Transcript_51553/m.112554 type:complete len:213 (-) Transcript_51553:2751-3389(-)
MVPGGERLCSEGAGLVRQRGCLVYLFRPKEGGASHDGFGVPMSTTIRRLPVTRDPFAHDLPRPSQVERKVHLAEARRAPGGVALRTDPAGAPDPGDRKGIMLVWDVFAARPAAALTAATGQKIRRYSGGVALRTAPAGKPADFYAHQASSFFSSPHAPPQPPLLPVGASRPRALSSTSSGGRCRDTRPASTLTSKVARLKPGLLMPLPVSRL